MTTVPTSKPHGALRLLPPAPGRPASPTEGPVRTDPAYLEGYRDGLRRARRILDRRLDPS